MEVHYLRQQPTQTIPLPVKHSSNINKISLMQGMTATHIHMCTECSQTVNIHSIASCVTEFCTKQSPWSFTTRYLTSWKSAASVSRTTLGQLRSGHCRLLNSYKARITSGISDVCPECGVTGVAPHSVEHLFNCQSHPMQLTVQDLWDNLAAVADFLNLDNWR